MQSHELLEDYLNGSAILLQSLDGLNEHQLDQVPVPNTWSIRQLVCHLTDAEIVYADRLKRVLVEDNPTIFDWSPDKSVRDGFCRMRRPDTEVELIACLRRHIHVLLDSQDVEVWQRTAVHSTDGPMTLETLLERITQHIPHHIQFLEQKKAALGVA